MTERQALEGTYSDRMDVFRRVNEKDPITKQTIQSEEQTSEGLICAVSQSGGVPLSMGGGYGSVEGTYTLFCSPDADVQEGDRLDVATKVGQTFHFRAGRPFIYVSHMEVLVKEEKRA